MRRLLMALAVGSVLLLCGLPAYGQDAAEWVSLSKRKAQIWGRLLAERDLQRVLFETGVAGTGSSERARLLYDLLEVERQVQLTLDSVARDLPTPAVTRDRVEKALQSYKAALRTQYTASWIPLRSAIDRKKANAVLAKVRQSLDTRCSNGVSDITVRFELAKSPGVPPVGHGFAFVYSHDEYTRLDTESDDSVFGDHNEREFWKAFPAGLAIAGYYAGSALVGCGECGAVVGQLIGQGVVDLVAGDRRNSATEKRADDEAFRYASAATSKDVVAEYQRYCSQFSELLAAFSRELEQPETRRRERLRYARSDAFLQRDKAWSGKQVALRDAVCKLQLVDYAKAGMCKPTETQLVPAALIDDPNCQVTDKLLCQKIFKVEDVGCRNDGSILSQIAQSSSNNVNVTVCRIAPGPLNTPSDELTRAQALVAESEARRADSTLSLADLKEATEIIALKTLVASEDEQLMRREVEAGELALRRARELALSRLLRLARLARLNGSAELLTRSDESSAVRRLRIASSQMLTTAVSVQLGVVSRARFDAEWDSYQAVARTTALLHASDPFVAKHLLDMSVVRNIVHGTQ